MWYWRKGMKIWESNAHSVIRVWGSLKNGFHRRQYCWLLKFVERIVIFFARWSLCEMLVTGMEGKKGNLVLILLVVATFWLTYHFAFRPLDFSSCPFWVSLSSLSLLEQSPLGSFRILSYQAKAFSLCFLQWISLLPLLFSPLLLSSLFLPLPSFSLKTFLFPQ